MPNPTLSDLRLVNQLNLEIEALQQKLHNVAIELHAVKEKNSADLNAYWLRQQELEKENRKRAKINQRLDELKTQEVKLHDQFLKSVHTKLEEFLSSKEYGEYITGVFESNAGDKPKLLADPELAKKIGLKDAESAPKGQIRLVSGVKTFIFDPQQVRGLLSEYLLQKTLSA